jgi:hypothetical protein
MKKRSFLNANCLNMWLQILQIPKKTASHGVDDKTRWINPKGESGAIYSTPTTSKKLATYNSILF